MHVDKIKSGVLFFIRVLCKDSKPMKRKYQADFTRKKETGCACKEILESPQNTVIEKPRTTFKEPVDDYQVIR